MAAANSRAVIYPYEKHQAPLPRHEILHHLRRLQESKHRYKTYLFSTRYCFLLEFAVRPAPALDGMTLEQADDCCNKGAPMYLVFSRRRNVAPYMVLILALHNYVYRKWFRRYRSDIEFGQYLVKVIKPLGVPEATQDDPRLLLELAARLNSALCAKVQELQLRVMGATLEEVDDMASRAYYGCALPDPEATILEQEFYHLQPLFRATAIIVSNRDLTADMTDIGQMPVLFVCTGDEAGLSAPVTLDAIADNVHSCVTGPGGRKAARMTLETAVSFLMDLERREAAAFGPQPDPELSARHLRSGYLYDREVIEATAQELGWGDAELAGPSSSWVDARRYTETTEYAVDFDRQVLAPMEKSWWKRWRQEK